MQLVMDNSQILVANGQEGIKIIQITDPKSGVVVIVPLPPDAARNVGAALSSSLLVASSPLPSAPSGMSGPH